MLTWWASLKERPAPSLPSGVLSAALALAAMVAVAAMPLVWHRLTVPSPTFSGPGTVAPLDGVDAASWLIAVALVAAVLAVRTSRHAPSPGMKVVVALLRELWNGNREPLRNLLSTNPERSVILWAWTTHAGYRRRYATAMVDPRRSHLRFVRITSSRAVERFLASVE